MRIPAPARTWASLITVGVMALSASAVRAGTFVYVSNAEDGDISSFVLSDTGRLTAGARVPAAKLVMPMAASSDGRFLYAVSRQKPFAVHAYRVDGASGALTPIGTAPLPDSMVNVTIDGTGRWLLAASYGGNVMSAHAIESDGRIGAQPLQFFPTGGNKPHSLRVDRDNRFVYVPHLGTDEVRTYGFDAATGRISTEAIATTRTAVETGPRHFVISPDNRYLYLLTEMTGDVIVYQRDAGTGALKKIQSVPTQPSDTKLVPGHARAPVGTPGAVAFDESKAIWCADTQMTPDGRFLYTSERTRGTLSRFAVDRKTGRLTWLGLTPTEAQPRGFAIDPSGRYLVASGEKSTTISLYAIDGATGALTMREKLPVGKGANWVQIVRTR